MHRSILIQNMCNLWHYGTKFCLMATYKLNSLHAGKFCMLFPHLMIFLDFFSKSNLKKKSFKNIRVSYTLDPDQA